MENASFQPVAIVGVGALFAKAQNPKDFWKNIISKCDLITDVPKSHWLTDDFYSADVNSARTNDKVYSTRGSFLDDVDFDPVEYGIPPNTLSAIDTAQLLALVVIKHVLQDVGNGSADSVDLKRACVIIGTSTLEAIQHLAARMQQPVWEKALRAEGLPESTIESACARMSSAYPEWEENAFPGLLSNVISGRIANRYDCGGANCAVDAACAGSLAAIRMAINELQTGAADMALTGGVDALNDIIMFKCFSVVGAISKSGQCIPFSDQADGTLLGEGIGLFAMKLLDKAEADGDHIYGVIKGMGASSDGRSKSIYAPVAKGQTRALQNTYAQAGYDINTVELVEGHGTGTIAGDLAEFEGLSAAFGEKRGGLCALGSIKSQIGHTKSAAGSAGLLKILFALQHKILPPTIQVDKPNEAFDLINSPIYINTETRPWIRDKKHPRRAGVSAFGFGGSNYHMTVEEYTGPARAKKFRTLSSELVCVLDTSVDAMLQKLQSLKSSDQSLQRLAFESQQTISTKNTHRVTIVADSLDDLSEKCDWVIAHLKKTPNQALSLAVGVYYRCTQSSGKIAFLFPGQGSQSINMGAELLMTFDSAMTPWDAIASHTLYDNTTLQEVVYPTPVFSEDDRKKQAARLRETRWTQPALAATSISMLNLLSSVGLKADVVAGHSCGELTALHAAGVMSEESLFEISTLRGSVMHDAASKTQGAMLAVKGDASTIIEHMHAAPSSVVVANYNSPEQLVLSGVLEDIETLESSLKHNDFFCVRLPVSSAFHHPMMNSASAAFKKQLKKYVFNAPAIPVIANTTAKAYLASTKNIPDMLANQLVSEVQFQKCVQTMYQEGVRTFVEVGPKDVLTKLVGVCLSDKADYTAVAMDAPGLTGVESLWHCFAKLIAEGATCKLSALWEEYITPDEKMVTDKKKYSIKINGSNYGKPYPEKSDELFKMKKERIKMDDMKVADKPVIKEQITVSASPEVIAIQRELQSQLVHAHTAYQKMMAETHMMFLSTMSHFMQGKAPVSTQTVTAPVPVTMPSISAPPPVYQVPARVPRQPEPVMAEVSAPPAPQAVATAPVQKPSVAQVEVPSVNPQDISALVTDIIVDKTGYPAEMLNEDMEIEADLGIDSIKRVEILSVVQQRVPNLPEMDVEVLASLKTLGDIVSYVTSQQGEITPIKK